MTTTIELAKQAGLSDYVSDPTELPFYKTLEAFRALIVAEREKELLATGMGPVGAVYTLRGVLHCTLTQEIGDTDLYTATQFAAARLQGERSRDAEVLNLRAALQSLADGDVMRGQLASTGCFSHADTVLADQTITLDIHWKRND